MFKVNLTIIKKFKNAFKFEKEADKESLKIYLNKDTEKEYAGMNWLYECEEQNAAFIGVDNNEVFAIDSEGYLISVCEGIENIPYELLRLHSLYATNELVQSVFDKNKDFEADLLNYEEWCKTNGIALDVQKIYHDENGNLFTQYFDKI